MRKKKIVKEEAAKILCEKLFCSIGVGCFRKTKSRSLGEHEFFLIQFSLARSDIQHRGSRELNFSLSVDIYVAWCGATMCARIKHNRSAVTNLF